MIWLVQYVGRMLWGATAVPERVGVPLFVFSTPTWQRGFTASPWQRQYSTPLWDRAFKS